MKKNIGCMGWVVLSVFALWIVLKIISLISPAKNDPDVTLHRYRMTVTVETPEGIKTGSAVRQIKVTEGFKFAPEMTPSIELTGEAVVVDLGKRGVLFGTMYGSSGGGDDYAWRLPFDTFPYPRHGTPKEQEEFKSYFKHAKAVLDGANYPYFFYFKDLNVPKTMEQVYKGQYRWEKDKEGRFTGGKHVEAVTDKMAEVFGSGVRIKEVTIEMTDDPVTWEIEKWLPWLKNWRDPSIRFPETYSYMGAGYFIQKNTKEP